MCWTAGRCSTAYNGHDVFQHKYYREICTLCYDYVSRYFGSAIVFDGYRNLSTKHMTHQRRTGGKIGVEVIFTEDMKLTTTKYILANVTNKQNFIDMLSRYLQIEGCVTHHSQGDADLLIAHTAVQSAASKNTVVIDDDTDFFIFLCYYAESVGFDFFMQCSAKSSTKKDRIWNI